MTSQYSYIGKIAPCGRGPSNEKRLLVLSANERSAADLVGGAGKAHPSLFAPVRARAFPPMAFGKAAMKNDLFRMPSADICFLWLFRFSSPNQGKNEAGHLLAAFQICNR